MDVSEIVLGLESIHGVKKEAIIVATIVVGLADRFLNIPDQVKKKSKYQVRKFERTILPRLFSGDLSLWKEFKWAISVNRMDDPRKTVEHFQKLPRRNPAYTHQAGYDYVLIVPVHIDNVNPPDLPRPNSLNIDVDREYKAMLEVICKAYRHGGTYSWRGKRRHVDYCRTKTGKLINAS